MVLEDGDKIFFSMTPTTEQKWHLVVKTEGLELDQHFELHDSLMWAQPLTSDFVKYFYTHKTLALPMQGSYKINGVAQECDNKCLMTQDSFKSNPVYPVNYFFATMQQRLSDGRSFGISMGDGMGTDLAEKLSNEDFLTLDGKAYKLDLTVV